MEGNYATRRDLRRGYSTQRTVFKMFVPLCFSERHNGAQPHAKTLSSRRLVFAVPFLGSLVLI